MPHIERRKSARVAVRIPVHVESGEGPDEGTITVISETGCSLDSKRRLRPGLLLCLYLPVGTEGRRDIAAQRVALVRTIDGNRTGLKFLTLTPQEQLELERTVLSAIRQFRQR